MRNLGPDAHLAARIERYMAQPVPVQLPERISLFGVGCLPESFMGLIHAAARRGVLRLSVPVESESRFVRGRKDGSPAAPTARWRAAR